MLTLNHYSKYFDYTFQLQTCLQFSSLVSKLGNSTLFDQFWERKESIKKKNELFDKEKIQQKFFIPRIEKIEVKVKDIKPYSDVTLLMNKSLSTPFNCAQHVSELYTQRSIVALIDDKQYWDLHRPLENSCTIQFKHFKENDSHEVNKIFWRSCCFLLGMVIQNAFKEKIKVLLHSWPKPNYRLGSFVYDAQLENVDNWVPTASELRNLTALFWKIKETKSKFERCEFSLDLAKKMFQDNKFKYQQLDSIASKLELNNKITLYRLDNHIDFSIGPMIPDTNCIGRVSVTAVHKLNSNIKNLYRFQGIAIPCQLPIHFFPYRILTERAAKLNMSPIPG